MRLLRGAPLGDNYMLSKPWFQLPSHIFLLGLVYLVFIKNRRTKPCHLVLILPRSAQRGPLSSKAQFLFARHDLTAFVTRIEGLYQQLAIYRGCPWDQQGRRSGPQNGDCLYHHRNVSASSTSTMDNQRNNVTRGAHSRVSNKATRFAVWVSW